MFLDILGKDDDIVIVLFLILVPPMMVTIYSNNFALSQSGGLSATLCALSAYRAVPSLAISPCSVKGQEFHYAWCWRGPTISRHLPISCLAMPDLI